MKTPLLKSGRPSKAKAADKAKEKLLSSLSDKKRINIVVTEEQHRMLKVYAVKNGKTITDILTDHIDDLLKSNT